MKKSHFRFKIRFYKLLHFLPYVAAIAILQFIICRTFQGTMGFYIFYPLVYVALEAGITGSLIHLIWYLNIFIYFPLGYLLLKRYNLIKDIKYLSCPHCSKMVAIFYQWGCDKCHNVQIQESHVTAKCDNCSGLLKTFVCEHCEEEFKL